MLKVPLHGKHGEGKFAVVDDDMAHLLQYRWVLGHNGYVSCSRLGRALHNVVMGIEIPDRKNPVDHIDRDPLHNRRSNLRIVPKSVDLRNRSTYSNSPTGHRFIYIRGGTAQRPSVRYVYLREGVHKTFNTLAEAVQFSARIEEKV